MKKIVITESQCKLLLEEIINKPKNITNYIKRLSQKYINGGISNCNSIYDINNGLCQEFAEDLENKFINGYPLDSEQFFNYDYDEAVKNWGVNEVIKTYSDGGWSEKMLKMYGTPPIKDIKIINDLPAHTWFYYEGKHYDAENPEGVNSPWKLTIMIKFFNTL